MSEYHISSFVIQVRPETAPTVINQLLGKPGVELHHRTDHGKLVITFESTQSDFISTLTEEISRWQGVLSCNLVFHQYESSITENGSALCQPIAERF